MLAGGGFSSVSQLQMLCRIVGIHNGARHLSLPQDLSPSLRRSKGASADHSAERESTTAEKQCLRHKAAFCSARVVPEDILHEDNR